MKKTSRTKANSILSNQEGSAIVIALMFLVLMTLVGIWATQTSNTEIYIARNEALRNQTFYRTEAGVVEAAFKIEEANKSELLDQNLTNFPGLLFAEAGADDMTEMENWENGVNSEPSNLDPEVALCAIDRGIAPGSSKKATNITQVRRYAIYAFHSSRTGRELMEVGYNKRF
jgi:hypothetical protein